MANGLINFHWFLVLFIASYFSLLCSASNKIRQGEILRDGDKIISPKGKFNLGFFSPKGSNQRYLGIWYADVPVISVVWVANRDSPVSDRNGVFTIEKNGNLVVKDGRGDLLWSTNVSVIETTNSTVSLLDTGNLVMLNNNNKALWQSFQHPTDTFLPEMRVYMDGVLRSWTSESDPSPGRYSLGVDPRGSPQIVIWDGSNRRWRSGYWDGLSFTGVPEMKAVYLNGFKLYNEGNRLYFTYTAANTSNFVKFHISPSGYELQQKWDIDRRQWSMIQSHPLGDCDVYNPCGNFAKCDISNSLKCTCLYGFVPNDWEQWNARNWSGGCVRRTRLECGRNSSVLRSDSGNGDGFLEIKGIKLPDFADRAAAENIDECKSKCLENCSSTAYAFVTGIYCMIWSGDLVDLQQFKEGGNTLYVRLAHSEFCKKSRTIKIVVISILVAVAFVICIAIWLLCKYKAKKRESNRINEMPMRNPIRSGELPIDLSGPGDLSVEGHQGSGSELKFFSFSSIVAATRNFSNENKLGQGGFGPVYKGKLQSGEEIAVKRLSRKSGQGVEEFKNEIMLIAKLQHRNLVRLLGCCIEGEEKILLYEYMPNRSLDSFLFDPAKQAQLNWRKRFNIIEGIARGLLYLHRDSRLRIIHRDLKASNILLDQEMKPKISDFGMARIFGGNQNEANTNRVVGTYGYMAPEYAMEGLFSGKSDVYSFGVLLLEIICGWRNTSFRSDQHLGIIGYAWEKWDEGRPMDLVDRSIWDECQHDEVLRCIHLALLCVQDMAVHRPNMSSVVLMLETDNIRLPLPRQPNYTSMRKYEDADIWNEKQDFSSNNVTISVIVGR
ncbi:G-type lectin S-receptor-like serine/threonine-protein kinase B120 [Nicotiana tomentosiformis]|uniref:G-type lectin S-receptor-like serine/threonine-protein kinase B120 n=1 Tax=Nicotiana tomentosiformis TaxID=4098 RepID=UPI00051BEDAF|nr:G-type lectin S-receptor-like serine/threonine-protein kinase B120 [Nicotiana tomentosiformis]